MKVIEYVAEVLPDGSLALPDDIRKELRTRKRVKVTLSVPTSSGPDSQKGWRIFKNLGKDAAAGRLSDPSTKHDEYLYGTRTPNHIGIQIKL